MPGRWEGDKKLQSSVVSTLEQIERFARSQRTLFVRCRKLRRVHPLHAGRYIQAARAAHHQQALDARLFDAINDGARPVVGV